MTPEPSTAMAPRASPRPIQTFTPEPALEQMPVSELVVGIAQESREIVSKYLELAKLDLHEELMEVRAAALRTSMAVAVGLVGAILLGLALSTWLASALGWSAAAALATVGGSALLVAGFLSWRTVRYSRKIEVPRAAIEAKEDIEWVSETT